MILLLLVYFFSWYDAYYWNLFFRTYGISCRSNFSGVRIVPYDYYVDTMMVTIRNPYWLHANKDGSQDMRYKDNYMIYPVSSIRIGYFFLSSRNASVISELADILQS